MISNLIMHEDNNKTYKDPLKFIDALESNKHVVLCYENSSFGKRILFRFIRNGLIRGEYCVYVTHDDDIVSIEKDMISNNINVRDFNKKGLLKICKISDVVRQPKGVFEGSEEMIEKMFHDLNVPFRLVIRFVDKLNTKAQIEADLALEQKYHSMLINFNGLVLCHYDVSKNTVNTEGNWTSAILENHHSAIFVTDAAEEEGLAFDMQ
jgi:KaiC/GvpD/RAD55 family RecA-like ATPase